MAASALVVLIVDSDPALRRLLVDFLVAEGYHATAEGRGTEALTAISRDRPALIFSEVLLPGLDGPSLCRRLRAEPRTRAIPLVFLTAVPEYTLRALAFDCGDWEYLRKPCPLDQILATVRRHLGPPGNALPVAGA